MLTKFKKLIGAGLLIGSAAASAAGLPFTVNANADPSPSTNALFEGTFTSNQINGSYDEAVRLNADGTFDAAILVRLSEFVGFQDVQSGLDDAYNLYVTVIASGSIAFGSGGEVLGLTNFSGTLDFFADWDRDTLTTDTTFFVSANDADMDGDMDLAVSLGGNASNDVHLGGAASLSGSTNFGDTSSFGLFADDFTLNAVGESFFIEPNPFYLELASSGDITGLIAALNGAPDADGLFRFTQTTSINFVPEPTALAFLGFGVFALGFSARRRNQK